MSRLTGKVAVVTGASKGIGAAIAQRFGREGASVVVHYATDRKGAEKVVAAIESEFGISIDIADALEMTSFEATRQLLAEKLP